MELTQEQIRQLLDDVQTIKTCLVIVATILGFWSLMKLAS